MPEEFFHVNPFRMDEIEEADRNIPGWPQIAGGYEVEALFFYLFRPGFYSAEMRRFFTAATTARISPTTHSSMATT